MKYSKHTALLISFLFYGLNATMAHAVPMLTLDNPDQTVARPSSGFIDVDFWGTLSIDSGDTVGGFWADGLYSSSGDLLYISDPINNPDGDNVGYAYRFSIRVHHDSPLGLYAFDGSLVDPAFWGMGVTHADGSHSNVLDEFSVTVVSAVPEPATLVLLGLGLAGFGFSARKKQA